MLAFATTYFKHCLEDLFEPIVNQSLKSPQVYTSAAILLPNPGLILSLNICHLSGGFPETETLQFPPYPKGAPEGSSFQK